MLMPHEPTEQAKMCSAAQAEAVSDPHPPLQTTPDLEQPRYTVLRKAPEYEVRKYEGYMVAETSMPAGSRAAAGDGFNDLAGYIFGGNDRYAAK